MDDTLYPKKNMDDMDIDHIVEVPDTPDRLTAQNGRTTYWRARNMQMEGSSRNTNNLNHGSLNWTPNGKKQAEVTGPNRRLYMRPPKRVHGHVELGHQRNPIILSPSDKSSPHGCRHSFRSEDTNKEKGTFADASFRSCRHNELSGKIEGSFNGKSEKLDMDASDSRSLFIPTSSNILGKPNKGKDKVGENKSQGSAFGCRENIDLSSSSKDGSEPRIIGRKRLVRNGHISPHNIAIMAKESDKESNKESKKVQPGEVLDGLVNGVVTDKNGDKSKGKGILMHPCSSKRHEPKLINQPSRHLSIGSNDDNGKACAPRDVVDGCENLSGWRSAHASLRYVQPPTNNPEVGLSGEDISAASIKEKRNGFGDSSRNSVSLEDRDAHRLTSGFSSMVNRTHELPSREAIRQKNKGSTLKVDNGRSQLTYEESEVVILGSSGESMPSSSRSQRDKEEGNVGSVIAIDESLPHMRPSLPEVCVPINGQDSDARARQLEADEMLARELQEQLYNESPFLGNVEIDDYVAQMFQQQEENRASFASFRGQGPMRPRSQRGSSTSRVRRRPSSQSSQNMLNQMGARARASNSRNTQLSRRGFGRSSGGRNFQFPLNMDLDMRIDILEALETALGDMDAVGTSDGILNIQRDFNENDYEMLLALDENNHHGGASTAQINSLPETKVQTDTFEEACAVCLETPTVGDTIRHLPCFHKFHKDCIDPWLSRKTSCPVCKSSIT